ncbi:DUF6233 domain-containing protein [Streptomyces sp. NBC_00012]|uniref:DUF6233 domain-containing protein n=1 Tax=Streptomyces sp. NBC_00012 TaxID=2975621 RepID=UPI002F9181A7
MDHPGGDTDHGLVVRDSHGVGSLYNSQFGFLDREDALIALGEPDTEPCQICNPQTGLQPHQ